MSRRRLPGLLGLALLLAVVPARATPTAARPTPRAPSAPIACPRRRPTTRPGARARALRRRSGRLATRPARGSTRVGGRARLGRLRGRAGRNRLGARDRARLPAAARRRRRRRGARRRRALRHLRLRSRLARPRRARRDGRRPAGLGLQLHRRRQRLRARRGRAAEDDGRRAAARDARARAVPRDPDRARRAGACPSGWPRRRRCGWRASWPPRTSIARSTGSRSGAPARRSPTGAAAISTSTARGGSIEQLEACAPRLRAPAARARGDRARRRRPGGLRSARPCRSVAGGCSRPRSRASRAPRSTTRWSARRCGRAVRPAWAPGGRIVLRAHVPPLGLRLWRVPATAAAVTRAAHRRAALGGRRAARLARAGCSPAPSALERAGRDRCWSWWPAAQGPRKTSGCRSQPL